MEHVCDHRWARRQPSCNISVASSNNETLLIAKEKLQEAACGDAFCARKHTSRGGNSETCRAGGVA